MMYRLRPNPRWTTEDRLRSLEARRAEREAPKETLAPPAADAEPVTAGGRPSRIVSHGARRVGVA